jgi:tRNA(fMet)-specific endonuclease VapC
MFLRVSAHGRATSSDLSSSRFSKAGIPLRTPKYMLDTNIVSFALRGDSVVVARVTAHSPRDLCVSALTVAELRYGAERRKSKPLDRLIDTLLTTLSVASFDEAAARSYGRVASQLAATGTPIGVVDTQLAAHAIALNVVMVTNNTRHFGLVKGLRLEDWSIASN